ncbi:MAG: hypothetical protein ACLR9F_04160, partial [Faecalibacterium prausnitzii]
QREFSFWKIYKQSKSIPVYQISKSFHTSADSDETAARSFCTLKPKGGFKCQAKPKNISPLPSARRMV